MLAASRTLAFFRALPRSRSLRRGLNLRVSEVQHPSMLPGGSPSLRDGGCMPMTIGWSVAWDVSDHRMKLARAQVIEPTKPDRSDLPCSAGQSTDRTPPSTDAVSR